MTFFIINKSTNNLEYLKKLYFYLIDLMQLSNVLEIFTRTVRDTQTYQLDPNQYMLTIFDFIL